MCTSVCAYVWNVLTSSVAASWLGSRSLCWIVAEKSIVSPCWTRAATGLIQRRVGEGEGKWVSWRNGKRERVRVKGRKGGRESGRERKGEDEKKGRRRRRRKKRGRREEEKEGGERKEGREEERKKRVKRGKQGRKNKNKGKRREGGREGMNGEMEIFQKDF